MDLKILLSLTILFVVLVSGHRHRQGKYHVTRRRENGHRRSSSMTSRFQGQGRKSRSGTTKKKNLVQFLFPYEAEENVKVRERMNVSLWKINGQNQPADHRRPKRFIPEDNRHLAQESNNMNALSGSLGYPWPLPQHYKTDPHKVYRVDPELFHFTISVSSKSCDTLTWALERYYTTITNREYNGQSVVKRTDSKFYPQVAGDPLTIRHTEVTVWDSCSNGFPESGSSESYTLHITDSTAYIQSKEVWGLLRGLETFSQIVYRQPSDSRQLYVNWTVISDYPRFQHRGVMMNTDRNYIHPKTIKKTLVPDFITHVEAMELNKLNVLHWQLSGDQAFPLVTGTYPHLGDKERVSNNDTYSESDITDILEFARQRGVRVLPELDTAGSWRRGLPNTKVECNDDGQREVAGLLDIKSNQTYTVLRRQWRELMQTFPDKSVHLGGIQISEECWCRSKQTETPIKKEEIKDHQKHMSHYTERLTSMIHELDKTKTLIFWDDMMDILPNIDKEVIIQIWRSNPGPLMTSAAERGHRIIYSSPWCLNSTRNKKEWIKFYLSDPVQNLGGPSLQRFVVGGEACMWGTRVNNANMLHVMWPRTGAVAERLWSAPHVRNVKEAVVRLEEQNCRMIRSFGKRGRMISFPS